MPRKLLAIASLLALTTLGSAAGGEIVHLNFDWPDNVKAKVSLEMSVVTERNGVKHRLRGTTTYLFEALATPDGFRITESDHAVLALQLDGEPVDTPDERLTYDNESRNSREKIFAGQYLVAKDGAFVDLHDFVNRYCEQVVLRFGYLKDGAETTTAVDSCRARVNKKEDPLLDYRYQVAFNQASNDWTRIVGWWVGSEMMERETYAAKGTLPRDWPPEKGIPTIDTTKFIGKLPCEKGALDTNCVRVEWVKVIDTGKDPRPVLELVEALFPAMLPRETSSNDRATTALGSMRIRNEIHLITDPRTLLPHWLEEIETVTIVVNEDSVLPETSSRKTHSIWTYEYELPQ